MIVHFVKKLAEKTNQNHSHLTELDRHAIKEIELLVKPLTKFRGSVLYHGTLKNAFNTKPITGFIIPYEIDGNDYNFKLFIDHIRSEKKNQMDQVPNFVALTEDQYIEFLEKYKDFDENFYQKLGVTIRYQKITSADFLAITDLQTLQLYQASIESSPLYPIGRHDKANTWGAYSLLKGLAELKTAKDDFLASLNWYENQLCEDPYYKKRIYDISKVYQGAIITDIIREQRDVLKKLSNKSILIVEDQLPDGWEAAYRAAFFNEEDSIDINFAETFKEAEEKIQQKNYEVVLLDMRLAEDRHIVEDSEYHIERLSGIRLAQKFRDKQPSLPIIAATASNKVWMLEALLEQGINGYWVKQDPEKCDSKEQILENLKDFYRCLNKSLNWSQNSRDWIEDFYELSGLIYDKNIKVGQVVQKKAKAFHALLHQSFSSYTDKLSQGLQLNLAFLIAWSLINDIIEWACEFSKENSYQHKLIFSEKNLETIILVEDSSAKCFKFSDEVKNIKEINAKETTYSFPDVVVIKYLLYKANLFEQIKIIDELREKRNYINLIHGKQAKEYNRSTPDKAMISVSKDDIKKLIGIYLELVKKIKV